MKKKLILIFLASTLPLQAHCDIIQHRWDSQRTPEKDLHLTPKITHFWSSKNFDSKGKAILPSGLDSISKTYFDLNASYGFTDNFAGFARLSWSRINVVTKDNSGRLLSGTRYGLGDQNIGVNYKTFQFENGSWIDLQAQAEIPTYSNLDSQQNQTPYLGDQTINLSFGPFFTLPFGLNTGKDLRLEAGAAFTWRTKDYSSHIPWKVGVSYLPKEQKGFTFALGTYGILTMKNDLYRSRNNLGTIAGGSNLVSAANPSFMQFRAQVGYAFTPQSKVFIEGMSVLIGQNAPKGSSIGLLAEFKFGDSYLSPHEKEKEVFLSYDFQASVMSVNDRLHLLKIDKGTAEGVLENQELDIFSVSSQGKIKEAVARGRVVSTKEHEAVVKISRFYKEVWIEKGFIVKRPIK